MKTVKKFLMLLLLSLYSITSYAYDFEVDGIYYNFSGSNAEVTYSNKYNGSYQGSIIIPNTVTYDGETYCVTSIGKSAFEESRSLTSITIPNSVKSIGSGAFESCYGLTAVNITDLEAWCNIDFESYNSNPLYFAQHLYLRGEEIKELVIPNSITTIGDYAFQGCSSLTSVTIPNSVTSIGVGAFEWCKSLTSITIPNSVKSIGTEAFSICESLASIIIPNSITTIGKGVFNDCQSLTSITIPKSVTSIESEAFRWCSGLTSITIPNSVTSLGKNAFYMCSSLTSINIPNSITTIEEETFSGCSSLTTVTIPNSITSIGKNAFYGCRNLDTFYCHPKRSPEMGRNVFGDVNLAFATLYVPDASLTGYSKTNPWSDFGTILPMSQAPDGIANVHNIPTSDIYYDMSGRQQNTISAGVRIKQDRYGNSRKMIAK